MVATGTQVLTAHPADGSVVESTGPSAIRSRHHAPTSLSADPDRPGRAWCGTHGAGVFRTEDGGETWDACGLEGERITALAFDPQGEGTLWAGTEPSALWRSHDGGARWEPARGLSDLPSAPQWAFPPRPETHHVRWITPHPGRPGLLWVAIEAGALVSTVDGGRSWRDRAPTGPRDTHELAIHPDRPDTLRVAAGDGYFESWDGGGSWTTPGAGIDAPYLRSVAIAPGDPDLVLISAASRPRSAYMAGRADGRLYRRAGHGPWERVRHGWPDPPSTIAPLLLAGHALGAFWAADERGIHHSEDGGLHWERVATFSALPSNLRGIVRIG